MAQSVRLDRDTEELVRKEVDRIWESQRITTSGTAIVNALIREAIDRRAEAESRRKVKP